MKLKYDCDYCGGWGHAGFDTQEKCQAHEQVCDYNPASRTCATCKHHDWPQTPEQYEKWGHYEDDGEFYNDHGCRVFNDQTWRRGCEKWEAKRPQTQRATGDKQ